MSIKKALICVSAAVAAACAFAVPVSAQEGGWGSDVEDFSASHPAQMKAEAGATDFSAALEAAAAAEGRSTDASAASAGGAAASAPGTGAVAAAGGAGKADSAAAAPKAEKKKKEKAPKAEGSGEKLGNNMGARLGVGFDIDLSLGFGIGMSDVNRLVVGLNGGMGTSGEYGFSTIEGFGFFDWNINLSDDGALRWFIGPGVTLGFYNAQKDTLKLKIIQGNEYKKEYSPDVKDTVYVRVDTLKTTEAKVDGKTMFNFGIGVRTGLEVDLSFIDPDHPLNVLRSSSVSLDVRLVLYPLMWGNEDLKNYPTIMPTLGITYNYVFGSGKSKENK